MDSSSSHCLTATLHFSLWASLGLKLDLNDVSHSLLLKTNVLSRSRESTGRQEIYTNMSEGSKVETTLKSIYLETWTWLCTCSLVIWFDCLSTKQGSKTGCSHFKTGMHARRFGGSCFKVRTHLNYSQSLKGRWGYVGSNGCHLAWQNVMPCHFWVLKLCDRQTRTERTQILLLYMPINLPLYKNALMGCVSRNALQICAWIHLEPERPINRLSVKYG